MSWSKKNEPNVQEPDLKRERRVEPQLTRANPHARWCSPLFLSPWRSADVGHQRKLGVSYTAISAAPGQCFYGAPAQAWYVLEYSSWSS